MNETNTMIRVTYWAHPDWDENLILSGTDEQARSAALGYVGDESDKSLLTQIKEDRMAQYEFRNLPEFEG